MLEKKRDTTRMIRVLTLMWEPGMVLDIFSTVFNVLEQKRDITALTKSKKVVLNCAYVGSEVFTGARGFARAVCRPDIFVTIPATLGAVKHF